MIAPEAERYPFRRQRRVLGGVLAPASESAHLVRPAGSELLEAGRITRAVPDERDDGLGRPHLLAERFRCGVERSTEFRKVGHKSVPGWP